MASFIKPDGTIIPMQEKERAIIYGHITEIRHIKNFLSMQDEVDIVIKVIVPDTMNVDIRYDPRRLNTGSVKLIQ